MRALRTAGAILGLFLCVLAVVYLALRAHFTYARISFPSTTGAWAIIRSGGLVLHAKGTFQAKWLAGIDAPKQVTGKLAITHLMLDGACVPAGTVLARFNDSDARAAWRRASEAASEAHLQLKITIWKERAVQVAARDALAAARARVEQDDLLARAALMLSASEAKKNEVALAAARQVLSRLVAAYPILQAEQKAERQTCRHDGDSCGPKSGMCAGHGLIEE